MKGSAVQIRHVAVNGRARLRVSGLYRSEDLKKYLEQRFSSQQEISRFSVNTLTGSVLVYYNSGNSHLDIASLIEALALKYRKRHGNNGASGEHGSRRNTSGKTDRRVQGQGKLLNGRRRLRKLTVHTGDQKDKPWHLMDADSVIAAFHSSRASGLSTETKAENLKKYGPNILPESIPRFALGIFLEQFKSLPVALLGAAAGLSIATGGVIDAAVILGVVGINAVIGHVTESRAEKTIHSLKRLVRPSAVVIRDSKPEEITSEEVVPGDILLLRPGNYIAADCRVIEAGHLSIDESALTGESMPVLKEVQILKSGVRSNNMVSGLINHNADIPTEIPLADRKNMVYMGTLVTGGMGLAVVTATGKYTEIGRIQTLVGEARPPDTPMEKQLSHMGSQLVVMSSAVCGLVCVIGLLQGYGLLEMLKISISLAVAAVPEGLPTVATTTLAIGIGEMKRQNVLIRHLDAVETLGAVQTICFDKTGTITVNRMSTVAVFTGMKKMQVSDSGFMTGNEGVNPYSCEELLRLMHVCILCNETEISPGNDSFILKGSPTENALIHMPINVGLNVLQIRNMYPLLKIQHRSDNRNYMITRHKDPGYGELIAAKGSPQEVLTLCSHHMKNGRRLTLIEEERLQIEIENERMAGNALRVLGVAYRSGNTSGDGADGDKDLTWLGLVGMTDPVRRGTKKLIRLFHKAGVNTIMITGDQSPTAYAIARELRLSEDEPLEILDSTHLKDIEHGLLTAISEKVHVFARVSPANKLQIVQALQSAGKVVAMTGDGINDGPALKASDIGIAMGHTGTDVAREVADVILEDDRIETMFIAVSHGRKIYDNIRKSIHFLLATNLSEIMVTITAITGGLGHPLNTMQLLWINLISDIFPGLALALEPPETDLMERPARDPKTPIIDRADLKRITFESAVMSAGSLGVYGYGLLRYGMGAKAGTMAFMSLTLSQLLHTVSCRSEKHSIFDKEKLPSNKFLNIALGGSFALQALAITVPGLRGLLGIVPVNLLDNLLIGGSAVLPLLVNEASKNKRQEAGRQPDPEQPGQNSAASPYPSHQGRDNKNVLINNLSPFPAEGSPESFGDERGIVK